MVGIHVSAGIALLCAAIFCVGCAGISVSKAPPLGSNKPMQGAPWNLAMTRFTVTITRHITACGPTIKGKVETLASANTSLDLDQRYLLTSNGWFATSDIKSTLTTAGFNSALNTESADATAAIVGNVIGTAAQVAIAFAAAGATPAGSPPDEICQKDLKAAVDALYPDPAVGLPLKKQVEQAIATLAQKTADVAVLSAQASAESANTTLKAKLVQAIADQGTARTDLQQKQDKFAQALKASTHIQTVTWPTKASELRRDTPFSISQDILDDWIAPSVDGPNATKQLDVYLALLVQPPKGNWIAPKAPADPKLCLGIPVRIPRVAKLMMCTGSPCPASLSDGQVLSDKQTAADFPVLQVGPVYSIPVSGGAFRSENAAISLDANGIPTVLQTTQKVAGASVLTGAAKDAATQLAALAPAIRNAELARTKAETDQINAEVALQTAQQTAGLQGETGILTAQTALINAQLANSAAHHNMSIQGLQQEAGGRNAQAAVLQAQAALATAQSNSMVADQTSALAAQATLINAETALLNAAAALVKAQTPALP